MLQKCVLQKMQLHALEAVVGQMILGVMEMEREQLGVMEMADGATILTSSRKIAGNILLTLAVLQQVVVLGREMIGASRYVK